MIKKRVLLILFHSMLFFPAVLSQNNGYMGKRFLFNVDASFSPAYFNPNFYGKSGYLHFNYILSPNIEIIAFKKGTAGLTGHYFNSFYEYKEVVKTSYNPYIPYFFYDQKEYIKQHPFRCYGFGIFYKQYFSRARAPLGTFLKLELDFLFHQYFTDSIKNYALNPGFKIEFGKDYLFWDRLRISYGTSIGLTFNGYKGIVDKQESQRDASANRVLGIYWIGFRIGVGVLAF